MDDDHVQRRHARYIDNDSAASDPGGIDIDDTRLRRLSPSLFGVKAAFGAGSRRRQMLAEHLWNGDSRAAVVMALDPVLVACYSDDFDAVVMLRFDPALLDVRVQPGTRLLAVNTFFRGGPVAPDIHRGPLGTQNWNNVHPVIADFCCADQGRVERRKARISEGEWQRTWMLGREHLAQRPHQLRDGAPHLSDRPAG